MIKIEHDSTRPASQAPRAVSKTKKRRGASGDKSTALGCNKILSAAVLALAAFGSGAGARELPSPWPRPWASNGIKPMLHQSAGGIQTWANHLPTAPRGHSRGLRQIALGAPVGAVPSAPVALPPSVASAPRTTRAASNAKATSDNWLAPDSAPRGSEAPSAP